MGDPNDLDQGAGGVVQLSECWCEYDPHHRQHWLNWDKAQNAMLSKSQARAFFVVGTALCSLAFIGLTVDTFAKIPEQTHSKELSLPIKLGKKLWEENNCMGCHTLLGEGAYYAPELTKVYQRRGPAFIRAMLKNPEAMYPGQRRMQQYQFTEPEMDALVAFFQWIGQIDLNGFPAPPSLMPVAAPAAAGTTSVVTQVNRPQVFNQLCIACHALGGQGGSVGPALDALGDRRNADYIAHWLRDPLSVKPDSKMPQLPLSEAQIQELVAFLSQLKVEVKP